ncbi:MAG: hypothetical protein KAV82_15005 [Phycisphaerae bacterium]|nr:hypothetical protein [Phycisphaerae bacterium]
MKTNATRWIRAALMAPLLALYGTDGCAADALRYAASELEDVANDIDGHDDDLDLGDYLTDWVEDL